MIIRNYILIVVFFIFFTNCKNEKHDIPINEIIVEVLQKALVDGCIGQLSKEKANVLSISKSFHDTITNGIDFNNEVFMVRNIQDNITLNFNVTENIVLEKVEYDNLVFKNDFSESVHFKLNQDSINYLKGVYFNYPKLIALESGKKIVMVKLIRVYEYPIAECLYKVNLGRKNDIKNIERIKKVENSKIKLY
jgi:hypothetical protein